MATKKKKATKDPISESAHKIWLAGLGALASAEEEGGRLFRRLVERGESFEGPVKEPVRSARGRVRETVDDVRSRAKSTVGRIEALFDDGVGSVAERLGVPSRSEIAALTKRVERLTAAVESMRGSGTKTRKKATKKKATKKSASKTTTTKARTKKKTAARKTAAKKKTTKR